MHEPVNWHHAPLAAPEYRVQARITSYNVCYTKLLRHTLGCKINQYEAEALREAWLSHGLSESSDASDADVIVVNACAVTAKAVADVRAAARAAHRANLV